MKPIAIHLDRLSRALAAKGIDLKRTDLLQVATAAFGYHNQNELSAASQRGNLTPSHASPLCRIAVPCTPHAREIVVLKTGDGDDMLYGMDAEFFDRLDEERAELYGPTPYGTLVDLRHARQKLSDGGSDAVSGTLSANARLDYALREARYLRAQLDDITGETDAQAQHIGQAENTLSRLIAALEDLPSTDGGSAIDAREQPADTPTGMDTTGDTLWKTSVLFDRRDGSQLQHREAHFFLPKGQDPTSTGQKVAWVLAEKGKVVRCRITNADAAHAGLRLMNVAGQVLRLDLPDDARQQLLDAMTFGDRVLPRIHDGESGQ